MKTNWLKNIKDHMTKTFEVKGRKSDIPLSDEKEINADRTITLTKGYPDLEEETKTIRSLDETLTVFPVQEETLTHVPKTVAVVPADERTVTWRNIFGNEFLVVDSLEGGMGEVFLGFATYSGKYQAAKTFKNTVLHKSDGSVDQDLARRFSREAITWLSLSEHPNIVKAEGLFEFIGKPYLFLEYIVGHQGRDPSLQSWLDKTSSDIRLMLDFSIQFCRGMAFVAEKAGIVHRDIKPSNIFVSRGGVVKISDFGLAKVFAGRKELETMTLGVRPDSQNTADPELTKAGGVFGTALYMSPEQWIQPDTVDERSDIYSFGAVMYAMLSGHPPFPVSGAITGAHPDLIIDHLRTAHCQKEPNRLEELNPNTDRRLCDLVYRCLNKEPGDRPISFKELGCDLQTIFENFNGTYRTPQPVKTFWNFYMEGTEKLRQGKHLEAIPYFENVLRIDNRIFHAHQSLGQCSMGVEEFQAAKEHLKRCIDCCPDYVGAMSDLGFICHLEKDEDTAITWYQKAITFDEEAHMAWNNLALSYIVKELYEDALAALDKALAIEPAYTDALENKAYIYTQKGDLLKAAEYNKGSLILRPGNLGIMHAMMMQLLEAGAYEAAERVAVELRQHFPDNKATPLVFAACEQMRISGRPCIPFDLGAIDFNAEMAPVGSIHFHSAVSGIEADYEALKIISWIELREYGKAADLAKRILTHRPNDSIIIAFLAVIHHDLRDYPRAIALAEESLALNSDELLAQRCLALCHQQEGRLEKALEHINRALELGELQKNKISGNPLSSDYNNKGNILRAQGRYRDALPIYDKALTVDPRFYLALENKAVCLYDMGRIEEALAYIERGLGIQQRSASGWRILGDIRDRLEDFADAIRSYRVALELDGNDEIAWNNLGRTLFKMNNLPAAEECFRKALEIRPQYRTPAENIEKVRRLKR